MKRIRSSLALLVVVLPLALAGRSEAEGERPTYPGKAARQVLSKYCVSCHGDKAPAAGLKVLDLPGLLERKLVVPKSPEGSELLELVECGMMPPGTRPRVSAADRIILRDWVRAGAPAPEQERPPDILALLLADARGRSEGEVKNIRYLSLQHLAGKGEELTRQQRALGVVLKHLTPPDRTAVTPKPLDEAGTLYAIDLRSLGWDRKPYAKSSLTLYDLVLLEYPYAVLPSDPDRFAEVSAYLEKAGQERPIPYVRADWLVEALLSEPLYPDFLKVLGRPAATPQPNLELPKRSQRLGLAEALAELNAAQLPEGDHPDEEWRRILARPDLAPLRGLLRNEQIDRNLWKRYYHQIVARRGGIPVVPLDGLTWREHDRSDTPIARVETIDAKAKKPRSDFNPGDRMVIRVSAREDILFELVYTTAEQQCFLLLQGEVKSLQAERSDDLGQEGKPLEISGDPGTDWVTLVAYPKRLLKADGDYPRPAFLQANGVHNRVVHPIYKLLPGGKGIQPPDPGQFLLVSTRVTTVVPPGK
jgi:hypothetical protein